MHQVGNAWQCPATALLLKSIRKSGGAAGCKGADWTPCSQQQLMSCDSVRNRFVLLSASKVAGDVLETHLVPIRPGTTHCTYTCCIVNCLWSDNNQRCCCPMKPAPATPTGPGTLQDKQQKGHFVKLHAATHLICVQQTMRRLQVIAGDSLKKNICDL